MFSYRGLLLCVQPNLPYKRETIILFSRRIAKKCGCLLYNDHSFEQVFVKKGDQVGGEGFYLCSRYKLEDALL